MITLYVQMKDKVPKDIKVSETEVILLDSDLNNNDEFLIIDDINEDKWYFKKSCIEMITMDKE